MRPKVSFVILKGARRNIPHDEPLGQSETKTITLRIHSIQVIPSGLLMSYRISLSEGDASVVSSRQRSGYYSFYHGLDGFMSYGDKTDQNSCPWQYKMSLRRRLRTITLVCNNGYIFITPLGYICQTSVDLFFSSSLSNPDRWNSPPGKG